METFYTDLVELKQSYTVPVRVEISWFYTDLVELKHAHRKDSGRS